MANHTKTSHINHIQNIEPIVFIIMKVVNDEQFLIDPHKTAEKYASDVDNDDSALVRSVVLGESILCCALKGFVRTVWTKTSIIIQE